MVFRTVELTPTTVHIFCHKLCWLDRWEKMLAFEDDLNAPTLNLVVQPDTAALLVRDGILWSLQQPDSEGYAIVFGDTILAIGGFRQHCAWLLFSEYAIDNIGALRYIKKTVRAKLQEYTKKVNPVGNFFPLDNTYLSHERTTKFLKSVCKGVLDYKQVFSEDNHFYITIGRELDV